MNKRMTEAIFVLILDGLCLDGANVPKRVVKECKQDM